MRRLRGRLGHLCCVGLSRTTYEGISVAKRGVRVEKRGRMGELGQFWGKRTGGHGY